MKHSCDETEVRRRTQSRGNMERTEEIAEGEILHDDHQGIVLTGKAVDLRNMGMAQFAKSNMSWKRSRTRRRRRCYVLHDLNLGLPVIDGAQVADLLIFDDDLDAGAIDSSARVYDAKGAPIR